MIVQKDRREDLVLASASPRRKALLSRIAEQFRVVVSGVEEIAGNNEAPRDFALRMALDKAEAVSAREGPKNTVIGVDTVLDFRGQILGKPRDFQEAVEMLQALSGEVHDVVSAAALLAPERGIRKELAVSTRVTMIPFNRERAEAYVATGEPLDKAGSYAIQGLGSALIQGIEGCYTNVVGLPVCLMEEWLLQVGHANVGVGRFCRDPEGSHCPRYGKGKEAGGEPK